MAPALRSSSRRWPLASRGAILLSDGQGVTEARGRVDRNVELSWEVCCCHSL